MMTRARDAIRKHENDKQTSTRTNRWTRPPCLLDSMVLSTSPRKAVPLASGNDWETSKVASVTRRAFFCGVVVESEGGNAISEGSSNLQHVVVSDV